MSAVPDGLPSLARGSHAEGTGHACVMEYVSVVTGERWTDMPYCTMTAIAIAAQALNDSLADNDRHLLVPFIGRLAEAGWLDEDGEAALYERVHLGHRWNQSDLSLAMAMKGRVGDLFHKYNYPSSHRPYIMRYDPDAGLKFLDEILTAHEELTGRDAAPVPNEALAKAKALIESGTHNQGVTIS